jgi:hypothetical protein
MPRRNRRSRTMPRAISAEEAVDEKRDYDSMARRLVRQGKASPLILGPLPKRAQGWGGAVSDPERRTAGEGSEMSEHLKRSPLGGPHERR